ncbi:TetR/AcrR family transcriptional regulator [Spirillospora sp. NPDC047279]|uniref:TetR/AcrR family transcriptional regulator n=1 Tax=Spirillospora sp. NPDC047279 TaxID=3155478 RepID=UPI00340AA8D6
MAELPARAPDPAPAPAPAPARARAPARKGRPPDPEIEGRALRAALRVYGDLGWAGFTFEAVARQARVGKAALYRRWPDKERLLAAALELLAEPPPDWADPDDLRGCLILMAEQVVDMFVGPKALVLPRVLIEASLYPPLFDETVLSIARSRFDVARELVRAAVGRGELPSGTPPGLVIDAIMGRVLSTIVLTPGRDRPRIAAEPTHLAASAVDFVLSSLTKERA